MIERSKSLDRYDEDNEDEDGGLLDKAALIAMFEESETNSQPGRELAEEALRFYNNDQLTEDERKKLRDRKQPEVQTNRIKRKIDYLLGLEKQQRTKPRALPRTPQHEQDSEACSDALTYVIEDTNYKMTRSECWFDMLTPGTALVEVKVKEYDDEICIEIERFPWDRIWYDTHSMALDFREAGYLGGVWWMDLKDAYLRWPDKEDIFEASMPGQSESSTYGDKPVAGTWGDRRDKRVRICLIWYKRGEKWYFAEFTKGGILKEGLSPYLTDDGKSDCGLFGQSAYVDQNGIRYGLVREMISPQKEINKRRSKALHLFSTNQILLEEGAVDNIEKFRREAARPDALLIVNQGFGETTKFQTRTDLAQGHLGLLQEAKQEIDLMGPNASMQGEAGKDASGRAIIASQQGGMTEMADLMDKLRHLDHRVYQAVWHRIRQFWTEEKWVRVTDDDRNVRFVGLNRPKMMQLQHPGTGQIIEIPQMGPDGKPVLENQIAQLEVDIMMDDVPDTVSIAGEQFELLAKLKSGDALNEIPYVDIIKAVPNLRNRDSIIESMEQRAQQVAQQQQQTVDPMVVEQQKAQLAIESKAKTDAVAIKGKIASQGIEAAHKERMAVLDENILVRKAQVQAHVDAQIRADEARREEHAAASKTALELGLADLTHREGLKREGELHSQSMAHKHEGARMDMGAKAVGHVQAMEHKEGDHSQAVVHRDSDHDQSKSAANDDMKKVLTALSDVTRGMKEMRDQIKAIRGKSR